FSWVALEYIRGTRPFGGFPWGQIGYAAAPYPRLLYLTSWTGIYGLTFLIVLVNLALAETWCSRRKSPDVPFFKFIFSRNLGFLGLALFSLVLLWAAGILGLRPEMKSAGPVALLQPSIDQSIKWNKEYEDKTFGILEELTRTLVPGQNKLVVWPETAAPSFLFYDTKAYEKVVSIARETKSPNLVGYL